MIVIGATALADDGQVQGDPTSLSAIALPIHPALRDVQVGGDGYCARFAHLRFIVSAAIERDGKWWLHASVSRRDRTLPTYEDVQKLKHYCIGDDKTAYQVFPPEAQYVHAPPTGGRIEALHLWHCLSGDVTPDFRGMSVYGRTI